MSIHDHIQREPGANMSKIPHDRIHCVMWHSADSMLREFINTSVYISVNNINMAMSIAVRDLLILYDFNDLCTYTT